MFGNNFNGSIGMPSNVYDIKKTNSNAFNLLIGNIEEGGKSFKSIEQDRISDNSRGPSQQFNTRSKSTFAQRKFNKTLNKSGGVEVTNALPTLK